MMVIIKTRSHEHFTKSMEDFLNKNGNHAQHKVSDVRLKLQQMGPWTFRLYTNHAEANHHFKREWSKSL